MKTAIIILVLGCLALSGLASCTNDAANDTSAADSEDSAGSETISYIFMQEGTSGSFVKGDSGNYTLTINGAVPYTLFFSDRPARDAGFIEMDKFLVGFGFDLNNPPNALVMLDEGREDSDAIVVELTSPNYDKINGTLTYAAKILDNYVFQSDWSKDLLSKVDSAIPESFGQVAIVIDNKVKLSCSDSTVSCQKVDGSMCGYIDTGCCWKTSLLHCVPCHDAETYDSECKSKYGSDCGYYERSGCLA